MRMLHLTAALTALLAGWAGHAHADPNKDESGKGRWRQGGYERSYNQDEGRSYRWERRQTYGAPGLGYEEDYRRPRSRTYGYQLDDDSSERRERRAFKQEYDDGNCKYERKLEKSGEYKEEVKCRGGRRGASPAYGYRY
jgi:hypothetical protein